MTIIVLLLVFCTGLIAINPDPYSVLGVSRTASKSEIQKAYRTLARKYHPDVSKDPNAEQMFTKIAAAYEELTKEQDTPTPRRGHGGRGHSQHSHEFYFNGQRFTFSGNQGFDGFNNFQERQTHKDSPSLTVKRFQQNVLPDSYSSIHLVKVTSRWCFLCMEYDRAWPDIMKHFKPYHMKFWELQYDTSDMRQKISVYEIPSFLVILSGRVYHFTKSLSLRNIEDFILSRIQSNLVIEQVHDRSVDTFVGDFTDYKVKLIFVSKTFTFSQAMAAFKYKDYYKFGFSSTHNENTINIQQILPSSGVVIFKEAYPAVSRKDGALTIENILKVMDSEKMLILPKICSPKIFDEVCQIRHTDQPCVIFAVNSVDGYKSIRAAIQTGELQFKRNLQFSFLYKDSQKDFLNSLKPDSSRKNVVLLQRTSAMYGKVAWLDEWDSTDSISDLYKNLREVQYTLSQSASIKLGEIVNEHAPSILDNILDFLYYSKESFIGQIHVISLNTWLTIIMIITLFFVTYVINNDPDEVHRRQDPTRQQSQEESVFRNAPEVALPELNTRTSSSLLPTNRSQITLLIVGDLSKDKSNIPLPVRVISAQLKLLVRNSIYSLAYASHVKYEQWLLKFTKRADCRLIQGSIIAVNFNKKYFYFFTPINTCSNSSLVNLQDRVTLWFERLCEGSLPKYFLDDIGNDF